MSLLRLTFSYLDKLNPFSFVGQVRLIINRLKAVPPVLVNPNPPIATMEGQLAITEQAVEDAKFGDRNAIENRDDEIAIMKGMVVQQGGTVVGQNLTAVEAQELGFRIAKTPTPAPPIIDAPGNLKAKPTSVNNGVEISWRRPKFSHSFQLQKTQQNPLEGNVTWDNVLFTTRAKVTVENLDNLGKYWFRVVGFSSSGQSPYSDPVMCVVL